MTESTGPASIARQHSRGAVYAEVMLLVFLAAMAAADCPEPFTEPDLAARVQDAADAIANDDVVGHGAVLRDLKTQLPCLDTQLPKDMWADFLVGVAVVDFALGRRWTDPLNTAMRAHPSVERGYGAEALRNYEATPPVMSDDTVDPAHGMVFLDGVPTIGKIPELTHLHVVQRFDGTKWETRVLDDEGFPADWLLEAAAPEIAPIPEPEPEVAVRGPKPEPEPRPKPDGPFSTVVTWSSGGCLFVYYSPEIDRGVLYGASTQLAIRFSPASRLAFDMGAWSSFAPLGDEQFAFFPVFRSGLRVGLARGVYAGVVGTMGMHDFGVTFGGGVIGGGYTKVAGPLHLGGDLYVGFDGALNVAPTAGVTLAL
jgi:hypothetical protein